MPDSAEGQMIRDSSGDLRPVPDPTALTTEALLREIGALRTLIDQRISASEALFDTKIQLGREANEALKETLQNQIIGLRDFHVSDVAGMRSVLSSEIQALRAYAQEMGVIRDQKFITVQTQFELIERQRVENKIDTKVAVDAALAAAKDAVKEQTTASDRAITKSEIATSDQLKQMNVTFGTAVQGVNLSISDLKDRVTALESIRLGGHELRSDVRGNATVYVAVAGLILTMIIIGISAIAVLKP